MNMLANLQQRLLIPHVLSLSLLLLCLAGLQPALAERTVTYFHHDALGSVVAASDAAGNLLWRKRYAPYGKPLAGSNTTEPSAYAGHIHDQDIGLTYMKARYYDPEAGRFMSPDPVGFVDHNPMSFNRYLYVNNNPYKYVDPDGEFLNFAAKFVLDVGVNVAFNYVTTGSLGVGSAVKESAMGVLNPGKTVQKVAKLSKALKGCCCYVEGTPVYAERGLVAIDQLALGDRVYARDPVSGEVELRPVTARYVTEGKEIYRLTTEDAWGGREVVAVTDNHPYWVIDRGWVESGSLEPGVTLVNDAGGEIQVVGIEAQGYAEDTYNIEVGEHHNYFVGEQRVLVHNCNCTNATKGAGRKGASGELTTTSGNTFTGNSTRSSRTGGDPRAPMSDQVSNALDNVKNPSGTHGACCEIDAMNKAANAGDTLRGARMGPVRDNKTGAIKPPCSTCRDVMDQLGVDH
ncbi:hypothetical protein FKG94_23730 [Exilibacterium tricleocarpae]|uniref:Uncharacterized protein n=1 Tax=Exilibacterium tricleocarpae TaxID=2591008 RepID=A0A545STL1_9GAMM|nr:RHS repeat-associated core domain-containing protein [Exilibacterium tricleocarpae]TQV68302.1 hypothetical protein FKG94_23730 [Exilibacterium tricleocarpae]